MQISSRFTMAIHMFACIDTFSDQKMTSDFMAASIGTNPVIIRKILQQLKAAGLIEVARGTGGVTITRPLEQITFLDVYKAVECAPDEQLFHFHENPNQKCPVGKNIHHVLDKRLLEVQRAMEEKLSEMTLADVKKEIAGVPHKKFRQSTCPFLIFLKIIINLFSQYTVSGKSLHIFRNAGNDSD